MTILVYLINLTLKIKRKLFISNDFSLHLSLNLMPNLERFNSNSSIKTSK